MSIAKINLRLLPLFGFLRWLEPLFPLYVVFASFYHLSYSQIFVTQIVFSFIIIFFDLPFGVLGDLLGEEILLRFGCSCYLIAICLLIHEPGFLHFCFAEALLGLTFASFSGADTTLLYRSCQIENRSYSDLESFVQFLARGAEGVSNLLGALLALISIPTLVLASFLIALLRLIISFRIKGLTKPIFNQTLFLKFKQQLLQVIHNFKIEMLTANVFVFIYSGLLGAIFLMNFWMMQIFLKDLHLDISWIALINFFYFLISALSAKQVDLIEKHSRFFFVIIPGLLSLPLLGLSLQRSLWELPLFICGGLAFGLKMPFIYQQLHRITQDNVRTSFLSLDNVITRIFFSILAYPLAHVIDHNGLGYAYAILLFLLFVIFGLGVHLAKES